MLIFQHVNRPFSSRESPLFITRIALFHHVNRLFVLFGSGACSADVARRKMNFVTCEFVTLSTLHNFIGRKTRIFTVQC